MADDNAPAANDAQRKVVKDLFKEAMTEWMADQEKTRTTQPPKKQGGLIGALGDLFND